MAKDSQRCTFDAYLFDVSQARLMTERLVDLFQDFLACSQRCIKVFKFTQPNKPNTGGYLICSHMCHNKGISPKVNI